MEQQEAARYERVTAIELPMLQEWVDALFDACSDISDAMCDADHNLTVDVAGLRAAAQRANVKAVRINQLGMEIEKRNDHPF